MNWGTRLTGSGTGMTVFALAAGGTSTISGLSQIETVIDEEIVFDQLEDSSEAIWSLLLASGYLKVESVSEASDDEDAVYRLSLTNLEVRQVFRRMVQGWFQKASARYNDFIKALLANNVGYMNQYMNKMADAVFSYKSNMPRC